MMRGGGSTRLFLCQYKQTNSDMVEIEKLQLGSLINECHGKLVNFNPLT